MSDGKRRILLIDDEPTIIKILGKLLQLAGFEVVSAVDGEEGISKAQSERPDVVVCDLMLPKMNGFDICATLKKDPQTQRIPIIVFTARGKADEPRCRELGASGYFSKTDPPALLIQEIRKLLGGEGG